MGSSIPIFRAFFFCLDDRKCKEIEINPSVLPDPRNPLVRICNIDSRFDCPRNGVTSRMPPPEPRRYSGEQKPPLYLAVQIKTGLFCGKCATEWIPRDTRSCSAERGNPVQNRDTLLKTVVQSAWGIRSKCVSQMTYKRCKQVRSKRKRPDGSAWNRPE